MLYRVAMRSDQGRPIGENLAKWKVMRIGQIESALEYVQRLVTRGTPAYLPDGIIDCTPPCFLF